MTSVSIVASAGLCALGRAEAAFSVGEVGAAAPIALRASPDSARLVGAVDDTLLSFDATDRAARLLGSAAQDLSRELDAALPEWRRLRLAVFVGTSAGAMQSMESAFALRARGELIPFELADSANYFSPTGALFDALGLSATELGCTTILAACASSTIAIGLACRQLELGGCDLAIAGGYDGLSKFVVAGFDALGALASERPKPFRSDRDGMALGEGAGLVALRRSSEAPVELARVLGFGASSDANHVTAPDREGRGLASAAELALADAGSSAAQIDFVSAHATATRHNDAAEACALDRVFGEQAPPIQAWKAAIGHTLGASGVLEVLAAANALSRNIVPAAPAPGSADDQPAGQGAFACAGQLLTENRAHLSRRCLKLSAAFGGLNAALVIGAAGEAPSVASRVPLPVAVRVLGEAVSEGDPALVARAGPAAAGMAERADSLSELVLAAVARLVQDSGVTLPERTAVIVGTTLATIDVNERFDQRRRRGLPVEPRRFPATSPSLCASVCSIAWGLRGPAFSVGAPCDVADAALNVASILLRAGDVPAALVVWAEDAGPVGVELCRAAGRKPSLRGARAALLAGPDQDLGPNARGLSTILCPADPDRGAWVRLLG